MFFRSYHTKRRCLLATAYILYFRDTLRATCTVGFQWIHHVFTIMFLWYKQQIFGGLKHISIACLFKGQSEETLVPGHGPPLIVLSHTETKPGTMGKASKKLWHWFAACQTSLKHVWASFIDSPRAIIPQRIKVSWANRISCNCRHFTNKTFSFSRFS